MICKFVAAELKTHTQITDKVKGHVYGSNIPKGITPEFAIKLRRISTHRLYNLNDELDVCQSLVQIEVWTRNPSAEFTTLQIANDCRLAMNRMTKAPTQMGDADDNVRTHGLTVERDATHVPIDKQDGSEGWLYRASLDVLITHEQETQLS